MLGWVTEVHPSGFPLGGELLGSNGKFYYFRADALMPGTLHKALSAMQQVSFIPGDQQAALFPFAEQIQPQAEEPSAAFAAYWGRIRARLSEKRALHCFKVAKLARMFAEGNGCSADKAEISGLLHDYAKEQSNEENARVILENKLPIASFELGYHHILHAAAGACLVEKELGITDPEILNGIRYHNGRPAMGTMEKIIFVADHIDKLHALGINGNPILDSPTLDKAIFRMILLINQYYSRHRETPDVITECTMNYMLQSISREPAQSLPSDTSSGLNDTLFDAALGLSARQSVHLRSVPNARHLGGYLTSSGRRIRSMCLVRSARLSDMTPEDAERLRSLGIDTVIDLRSPSEVEACPDRNIESFRYISCPLPTVELSEYQKNLGEKYAQTTVPEEKAFYLSEYLTCLSMEDMYLAVLTDAASVESLQKVFSVLADSRVHGAVFHCTSGKDRTGIVAALLLLCLGADLTDIQTDYYASAVATFAQTEAMAQSLRREQYSAAIDEIRYYNGIGKNIAEHVFRHIAETYGSAEAYLTTVLQLKDEQRKLLCEKYLEGYEKK